MASFAAFATRNLKTVLVGILIFVAPSVELQWEPVSLLHYSGWAAIEHKHETPNAYD
jgi:hypothetical protein